MNETLKLSSLDDLDRLLLLGREAIEAGEHEVIIRKPKRQRTITQNKSLHKYCETMAQKLTDAGLTQRKLWNELKPGFELSVTMEMVKDIFRSVGKSMYRKESTSELTTVEIQSVYQAVDQGFGETTGCRCDWPSKESLMMGGGK